MSGDGDGGLGAVVNGGVVDGAVGGEGVLGVVGADVRAAVAAVGPGGVAAVAGVVADAAAAVSACHQSCEHPTFP